MGIAGLLKLIKENRAQLLYSCGGKVLVDGYVILHDLYSTSKLDWANGGSYGKQHLVTVQYYEAMVNAGMEPIVILEGGGSETKIQDTVDVRKTDINNFPGDLRKQHENVDSRDYRNHYLPLLSRQVYMTSLKHINGLQVYVSDGKTLETIVKLANHYECPVLTNNTNYCVSGVTGGVIFYKWFDSAAFTAPIFKQTNLVSFLKLQNPDLIFAIVAILGNKPSIPGLHHGRFKRNIERLSVNVDLEDRPWILTIADYLNAKQIHSFQEFKDSIFKLDLNESYNLLHGNCLSVEEIFGSVSSTMSIDEFKETTTIMCSRGVEFPKDILLKYRTCIYPETVVNAVSVGKCTLEVQVGDSEQPPASHLGKHIRQFMYGLATPLMRRDLRKCVIEYYRSEVLNGGISPWKYAAHRVEPVLRSAELSTDAIFGLDNIKRKELARTEICKLLQSPPGVLVKFSTDMDSTYLLAILTTCYWTQHLMQSKKLDHPEQLVKSLVLNFFVSTENDEQLQQTPLSNPWIKVDHALLEWQVLYRNVVDLNFMLLCPFRELHPSNILDCPFVIELALDLGSEDTATYRKRLTHDKLKLYDKILTTLNV